MSLNKTNKIQIIKYAPPPPDLPTLGQADPSEVSFIGRTNYVAALEEKKFVFGIKRIDRKRHVYIIGKSGVGKSKLQELMIRQDIAYGHGICVIDPDGDLVENILNFIPKERINDVCLLDPTDTEYPPSFNPLSDIEPMMKHQLTQKFVDVIRKHFTSNWNAKIEHITRFAVRALLDHKGATMRGMVSMITDQAYREEVIASIEDEMVKRFWITEFPDWAVKYDTDAINPLLNKLGQFLTDPMLGNMFRQKENKINFEDLMNNQKIVLVNLAKGKIGEENSSFFGSVVMAKIKQAGMSRGKMQREEHPEFYVYMDEFQNIITDTFESFLSESRKYGIILTLTHRYIGQLSTKIQQAVLGNVGSIMAFRVGGDDATKLKPEFAPVFDIKDMINLGLGEFYIKMTIEGESYDPFSAETLKVLPPTHQSFQNEVLVSSRAKYAVSINLIK